MYVLLSDEQVALLPGQAATDGRVGGVRIAKHIQRVT